MSIHAISGKPGGGKSMYATKLVLDELLFGSRTVITNLPLNLGRLNEYIQEKHPEKSVDLHKRVKILNEDETQKFWTYRPALEGGWVRIPEVSKQEWSEGKKPSYAAVEDSGVMYVIDECHNFFNARSWMEVGRDVLFYLSQHRHLGDTVIWITQAVMNVDKQFRSVTQDYTYLRNLSKEKSGLFRLPRVFLRKTFLQPATDATQAMETGTFRLDVTGLASLYSTAAGVGIHDAGQKADIGERRKGVHWVVFVIGLPLLIFAIVKYVPQGVGKYFETKQKVVREPARTNHVERSSSLRSGEMAKPAGPGVPGEMAKTNRPEPVRMVGYAQIPIDGQYRMGRNGLVPAVKYRVFLSDGSDYESDDGRLTYLCPKFCVVDGRTNWLQAVRSGASSESLPGGLAPTPFVNVPGVVSQSAMIGQVLPDAPPAPSTVYVISQRPFGIDRPAVRSVGAGAGGGGFGRMY